MAQVCVPPVTTEVAFERTWTADARDSTVPSPIAPSRPSPQDVATDIAQVAAADAFTCEVRTDRPASCWGVSAEREAPRVLEILDHRRVAYR